MFPLELSLKFRQSRVSLSTFSRLETKFFSGRVRNRNSNLREAKTVPDPVRVKTVSTPLGWFNPTTSVSIEECESSQLFTQYRLSPPPQMSEVSQTVTLAPMSDFPTENTSAWGRLRPGQ